MNADKGTAKNGKTLSSYCSKCHEAATEKGDNLREVPDTHAVPSAEHYIILIGTEFSQLRKIKFCKCKEKFIEIKERHSGIGVATIVKCHECGREWDITDYTGW